MEKSSMTTIPTLTKKEKERSSEKQNLEKAPSSLRNSALIPFLLGFFLLILLTLIICNELFWVEGAGDKRIPVELWFVLSPGFMMMGGSFLIAFYRWRSSRKLSPKGRIELKRL
jgi:hypothetical protein